MELLDKFIFSEMIGNYELLLDSHVTAHGSLRHDEL